MQEKPPEFVSVTCHFVKLSDGRLQLTAYGFDTSLDQFFQLRVPGFTSPRSTTPTASVQFTSYDSTGKALDTQLKGLVITATDAFLFSSVTLTSSSQFVADSGCTYTAKLTVPVSNFLATDQIQIRLPKWNTLSTLSKKPLMAKDATPKCLGLLNTRQTISCSLVPGGPQDSFDTLVLVDPFDRTMAKGEQVSFSFSPLLNPTSSQTKTGFTFYAKDSKGGSLAQGAATLTVTNAAVIAPSDLQLNVDEPQINKQTFIEIQAKLPVPLEAGCLIKIQAPSIIRLDVLQTVMIHGMFGAEREATFSIVSETNTIEIRNACMKYTENFGFASIDLINIINPSYVAEDLFFVMAITDADQKPICTTDKGLFFKNTPGPLLFGDWSVTNPTVSGPSSILFSIKPEDPTVSHKAMIKVHFPADDFPVLPEECNISQTNQYISNAAICSSDTSKITLINVLKEPFRADGFINFMIDDIVMPTSVRPTGTFDVEFYDSINGKFQLVSKGQASDKIRAVAGELNSALATPKIDQTFADDIFDFEIFTAHNVLQGGRIEVTIPDEMKLLEKAACLGFEPPLSANARCEFNGNRFIVLDAFRDGQQSDIKVPLKFQVGGILTSRSSKPVSGFGFKTLDRDGNIIDSYSSFVLDPLKASRPFEMTRLETDQLEVGKIGNVTVWFKSPVPLFNGDLLYLQGPQKGMSKDLSYTYESCKGILNVLPKLQCTLKGTNGLEIVFETAQESLPADTEFSLEIHQIQNPPSLRPSDPFSARVEDKQGYLVAATDSSTQLAIKATQPSTFLYASVVSHSRAPRSETILTFTLTTQHEVPANGAIKMHLPALLKVKKESFSCWVSSNPDSNRKFNLSQNPDGSYEVLIMGVTQQTLTGGNSLTLELRGLVNADTDMLSESYQVTTQTSDGYSIDQKLDGLVVSALCNFPCITCTDGQPNHCTSCDPTTPFPILFKNQCITSCPAGFFFQDFLCPSCDKNCLECTGQGEKCTKCAPGRFLLGNTCLDFCPDEYYANVERGECLACESPCKTCMGSPTHCTSCDAQTKTFLLFDNKCFDSCPADVSVFSEGKCVGCSSNCATCSNKFDSCATCKDGWYLSKTDMKCQEKCPSGISVASLTEGDDVKQALTCEKCDDSCQTCSTDNPKVCSECREGLMLVEETKQCLNACPLQTAQVWIPLTQETLCARCADGCSECMYARDHCTMCLPGFVFHQYTCLKECPADYRLEGSECVLEKKQCSYGYTLNASGECEFQLAKCNEGYVLNGDLDKCIPEPGFHFPFAFIYASIAWAYIVLRKANRQNFSRETLASQLLIGLTFIQQVGYFTQFGLSIKLGFGLLFGFHLFALIIGYFLNFGCLVAYLSVIKDPVFDHWRNEDENDEDSYIILTLTTVFSYKAIRLYYCQLFSKPYFNAASENTFRTFIKPMWILNMAGLLQSAAILLVNVYTIWLLEWGYEIKTLAFESLGLCLVISGLEVYEYIRHLRMQPKYMAAHEFVLTAKQRKQVAVMAADEENDISKHVTNDISILETVIRRLNETDKLALIKHNMDQAELDKEGDPVQEDEKRRQMLKTSAMQKQNQFREKRKQFEYFRTAKKQVEKAYQQIGEVDVSEIELQREEEHLLFVQRLEARQLKSVLPEIDFELLKRLDPEFRALTRTNELTPLEQLQHLSEYELTDDHHQFARAYTYFKDDFDQKARNGTLVPNMKVNQSFDEDVLREMYDDFGPESDFESELSWISYPPKHGFIREFWENNPRKLAEGVVFRDKIKYKFKYSNCMIETYPVPVPIPKVIKPSRRTQTYGVQANSDFEPFASANEISDSQESEQLSVIDDALLGICDAVVERGFSSDSQETFRVKSEIRTARSKASRSRRVVEATEQKVSRKRKRPERATPMRIDSESLLDKTSDGEGDVKLGTVFDKDGKVLYDKDYISHIDATEPVQITSEKSESHDTVIPEVEEEVKEQPGLMMLDDDSESDYSQAAQPTKKRKRSPLQKAYQPDLRTLVELEEVGKSSLRSSKTRKSGKSAKRSDKDSVLRAQTAFSANVMKKSETDDLKDDETRENNSSAVYTTDHLNKQQPNPGYSAHWDQNISGDISVADSRPFTTKNAQREQPQSQQKSVRNRNMYEAMPDIKRYQSLKAVQSDDDVHDFVAIRRPQPFTALGVDTKPYRANTRKRQKQMMQDQRRAMVTDAFSRLNKLESIYLKTSLQRGKNMTPPPMPVTEEYLRAMQRHQSRPLKKLNFIEDGYNIVTRGAVYERSAQAFHPWTGSRDESLSQDAPFHAMNAYIRAQDDPRQN